MTESKTISSPSVWYFIAITAAYSGLQYFTTSPALRMMITLGYFLAIIIVQFFLNLNVAHQLCGGSQYGTAALVTFIPWFLIFGLLKMMLTVFPGWLSPFSNTLGYMVASLAGVRGTLDSILKPKITGSPNAKASANALEHIYNDPSLLINEITPRNFDNFWETMKSGGLFKSEADSHKSALRKLVRLKDIVSEFVWFVMAGSLVASISFNFMLNKTCSLNAEEIKNNVKKADTKRADEAKEDKQPPRVYSSYE